MLTVLSVAFPFAPVRPEVAGGAEQILLALDRALAQAGHRSIVIAAENSLVSGELIGTPVWDGALENSRQEAARCHRNAIEGAIARFAPDLVHYHGFDFPSYAPPAAPPAETPALATLHLPPDHYPDRALSGGKVRLYCVSSSQKRACPAGSAVAGIISNGVDTRFFRPRGRPGEYAIALGRICKEKGFHLALDAAYLAGIPLLLAGEVFPYVAHREYFECEIRPRLVGRNRFLGAIGPERKRALLAGARCLLAPSLIDETSSLTAMEALACGTPVIARPAGALREIVEHGRTGFLAATPEQMARAIEAAGSISRNECRRAAERKYDVRRMIDQYLGVWSSLAAGRSQPVPPMEND